MSNEFCHCDSERGSNRFDSFLLEILGLLPYVAMTGLGFLLWVVEDIGIASLRRNDRFEFCHCDEERGSNLTDSFLLEILGLLWCDCMRRACAYRLDALNSERTGLSFFLRAMVVEKLATDRDENG